MLDDVGEVVAQKRLAARDDELHHASLGKRLKRMLDSGERRIGQVIAMLVQGVATRAIQVAALRDVQVGRQHARLGHDALEEPALAEVLQERRIDSGNVLFGNVFLKQAGAHRSPRSRQTDGIPRVEATDHRDSREVEQNYPIGESHTSSSSCDEHTP